MVRFNQPEELSEMPWWFSPLNSSKEDLYMVPEFDLGGGRVKKPLHGFKFNFRTGKLQAIKHLGSMDSERYVVSLRGDICFIAPYEYDGHVFVRYDPDKESWNGRNPVGDFLPHIPVKVVAIAVWEDQDTILLNMDSGVIFAYDVSGDKWYRVEVEDEDKQCYAIVGEAVVLENTIYALTDGCHKSVVALSIGKTKNEEIDADPVFKCSLLKCYVVEDMEPIAFDDDDDLDWVRSRHLVHLGKDDFCVVQCFGPVQVTYITLRKSDNVMIMTYSCVVENGCDCFLVQRCFTLPKGATTGLKQGTTRFFDCDPYVAEDSEDYVRGPVVDESGWLDYHLADQ